MPTLAERRQIDIAPPLQNPFEQNIEDAFEWNHIITQAETVHGNLRTNPRPLALYVFRSIILPNVDTTKIAEADDAAYAAITGSPDLNDQLISYYRGERDLQGRALSMCLWKTAQAAMKAVHGNNAEAHRYAAEQTQEFYGDNWSLETWSVLPTDNGALFIPHDNPHSPTNRKGLTNASLSNR